MLLATPGNIDMLLATPGKPQMLLENSGNPHIPLTTSDNPKRLLATSGNTDAADNTRELKDANNNTKDPDAFLINHVDDFPDPVSLLGKYIIVLYNRKPYRVLVTNIRDQAIEVNCMHRIGKLFYWPKHSKDINWYLFDEIVAIIPEPLRRQGRHYTVEEGIWNSICSQYH
jgi:hypothetical protein